MRTTSKGSILARTASAAALIATLLAPASPAAAWTALPPSEWVIGPQKRVALITFEGRTTNKQLLELLAILGAENARGSFFFPGGWVAGHQPMARRVRQAGHALGNRGFGSTPFTDLTDDQIRASIERGADALRSIGAYPRPLLRAPKGARDLRVLQVAGSMGYRSVRWTHHPGGGLAKRVQRAVVRKARPGSIISLDLWRNSHRSAVAGIVDGLRRRGFELRTIEHLERVHAVRWDVTLGSGSSGAEVYHLQKALRHTSYPSGPLNSSFGYPVLQAVYAFEKVHGLSRDGVVTPHQMEMIVGAKRPFAPEREAKSFVDVDISRQVLFEIRNRRVVHTLPISSGNEGYYTVDGQTYKSHTPRGAWSVVRKIPGWRTSRLGRLWYPSYFVGGFAIHGSESVPTYPASHGCIRIPMYAARRFYDRNPIGMPVYVHD